ATIPGIHKYRIDIDWLNTGLPLRIGRKNNCTQINRIAMRKSVIKDLRVIGIIIL
ncbi:MAG: hypothetical protein K940chlam6_01499, partial [Chlamydiae bacterium]|nr:hypothetical protein [Chlamydiota bacterium]